MKRWIRTDLAMESGEMGEDPRNLPGVVVASEFSTEYRILTTTVRIEDARGEKALGKPRGRYVTIESDYLKENHLKAHQAILALTREKLLEFLPNEKKGTVLVVGLGNRNVTADALGPMTVERLLITRHIYEAAPLDLKEKLGSVCAIAPGVMGQTGMETEDHVLGVVERIRPRAVILIDALATASINRMHTTIQISDSGIGPGAGMGNFRKELSGQSLHCPVVAIGVPTVIDAATIVAESLSKEPEALHAAAQAIEEMAGELYVTSKDMDILEVRMSNLLAGALNQALHGLSHEEMQEYLY